MVERSVEPNRSVYSESELAGKTRSAYRLLYTIIESCRCRRIDPWTYLRDVFTRLPHMTNRQIGQVTPEAWAKDRQAQASTSAAS